ncbi:hypothetical protein [Lyngbya aestuarii]|uniref:hypothetical protein n=1 Tax=Lyngbya aestuarii TaxID=118322 RepID=UPI00403DA480
MFGFINNLFGSKKKSEDGDSSTPKAKKGKEFFLELDEASGVNQQEPAKKPQLAEITVPKKDEAPKAESANKAAKKAEKSEPAKAPKATPQPTSTAATSNGKVEPQPGVTFAPNYLLPKATNSRRRPGPSMNTFRDMARQVKTPSN